MRRAARNEQGSKVPIVMRSRVDPTLEVAWAQLEGTCSHQIWCLRRAQMQQPSHLHLETSGRLHAGGLGLDLQRVFTMVLNLAHQQGLSPVCEHTKMHQTHCPP